MTRDVWATPLAELPDHWPVVASFGGGLNSTAELIKWALDGNKPIHLIQFSDTGDERPETYEHIQRFSRWLVEHGMPPVTVTRKGGRQETLLEFALRTKHMPSRAYGGKSCSHKFKIEPQERDVNRWPMARAAWKRGDKVVKLIGYGYEEQRRISLAKIEDDKYFYRFPLNEWQIDRQGCVDIIKRVGLPVPPKSSCYHCPSMTKPEIDLLYVEHPILMAKALHMEAVALENREPNHVKSQARKAAKAAKSGQVFEIVPYNPAEGSQGLGRKFAWRDYLAGKPVPDVPAGGGCMFCIDDSDEAAA